MCSRSTTSSTHPPYYLLLATSYFLLLTLAEMPRCCSMAHEAVRSGSLPTSRIVSSQETSCWPCSRCPVTAATWSGLRLELGLGLGLGLGVGLGLGLGLG